VNEPAAAPAERLRELLNAYDVAEPQAKLAAYAGDMRAQANHANRRLDEVISAHPPTNR
jgi:hypothetical protein